MGTYRKRLVSLIIAMTAGLALVLAPTADAITVGGPSDCDSNAVIRCGAHSTSAMRQAYNSSAYVQKVFAFFGISGADMANLSSTNVAGRVTKDGKVFVNSQSQAVATGAVTGGRQDMPGSTKVTFQGITFFKRPPSVSFQQDSLPAFVSMKDGRFQFAIIASCGNAVRAVPTAPQKAAVAPAKPVNKPQPPKKPQPKPVKPKPAPAPSQQQQQQQSVTQNVTQNQQVTVNNETTAPPAEETAPPQEIAGSGQPPAPEAAAAPQPEGKGALPNVGPEGTVGIFLGSSVLGVVGYRRYLLHLLGN